MKSDILDVKEFEENNCIYLLMRLYGLMVYLYCAKSCTIV